MSDWFAVAQRTATRRQGAWLLMDRARPLALGARELLRQRLGLLFQEGGGRTFGQTTGGGDGDLFQGGEVGVETGTNVPEDAMGHNLAPAGGQVTEFLELFRSQWRSGHALPCLRLASRVRTKFSSLCNPNRLGQQSRSWPQPELTPRAAIDVHQPCVMEEQVREDFRLDQFRLCGGGEPASHLRRNEFALDVARVGDEYPQPAPPPLHAAAQRRPRD